jgi:ABC-type phosphate transport system permease subunit
MTRWRSISRVQIPVALPGLIAGAVLAAARATGEAIALSMVAGALALTPGMSNGPLFFFLTPIRTMASAIVETGGEAMSIPQIEAALFGLAALLLLFSLVLSVLARFAFAWSAKRLRLSTGREL